MFGLPGSTPEHARVHEPGKELLSCFLASLRKATPAMRPHQIHAIVTTLTWPASQASQPCYPSQQMKQLEFGFSWGPWFACLWIDRVLVSKVPLVAQLDPDDKKSLQANTLLDREDRESRWPGQNPVFLCMNCVLPYESIVEVTPRGMTVDKENQNTGPDQSRTKKPRTTRPGD